MISLVAFVAALFISSMLIPLVRYLSVRYGRIVQPRQDRWHRKPIATLGGIGIFLAFILSLCLVLLLSEQWEKMHWGILIGSVLIFFLGLYDDFKHISPQAKLVGQILAATLVIAFGYTSYFFSPRIQNEILAQLPNILLTFFWLVGITNAINLLDNMDGLAGGISTITALILSYFFFRSGDESLLWISLALAGSCIGFLFYNFPPASIFMGDSGSLFLGFTLAVLAIARQPQASNVFAIMGVPTLLFLIPIMDTALVTFTRLLRGQSPMQGGRDHTSHRLIAFGLTERQAVLFLYAVALLSGIMAAALEAIRYWFSLAIMPILVVSLALITAYLGGLKLVPVKSLPERGGKIARIMLDLTFRLRLLEVILDFFLIGIAYYLAFLARYSLVMNESRLELYLQSLPLVLGATYLSMYMFGVYRGVWRYVDFGDFVKYLQATVGSVVVIASGAFLLDYAGWAPWSKQISPLIFLLFAVFLLLGLITSRSSFRILDRLPIRRSKAAEERVLIYGAGDCGEIALRWILMNPQLKYHPIGFIDDDPYMNGRQIHGVQVVGGIDQIEELLDRKQVDGIILAGMEGNEAIKSRLLAICSRYGCWVSSLHLEFETVRE